MKILQVNKYYYPRGGADKYFLDLTRALEAAGHTVAVFSMTHPKNFPSPWNRYFVSRLSFNRNSLKDRIKTPGRVLYSLEAKKKFSRLIRDFQPDIIHCHNIYHHLSPSILTVAKAKNIPVVMHLHDYKLICPNHTLFTKGAYCERCRPRKYYQCLKNRCIKDSFAGSALAALEMYLHHSLLKIYEKNIDLFIAPSYFMKETAVRFGQAAERIEVIYNPYNLELSPTDTNKNFVNEKGDYLLYFGRLSSEKGLNILIQAAALTSRATKIVGDGPEGANLKTLTASLKAPVEFFGFKTPAELKPFIIKAQAVVIPSIWAENMPLSLLESLNMGKIVIVSRRGGLPEVIKDKKNGLLFTPGDIQDLARCIDSLGSLDKKSLCSAAKDTAAFFSPEKNLAAVLAVYKKLLT